MKLITVYLLWFLLISESYGQNIPVEYSLENKLQKLSDDFSIYFVWFEGSTKHIVKPLIENNSFELPDFKGAEHGDIIFKKGKKMIGCNIKFEKFSNLKYRFGIDKKPFNENYSVENVNDKNVKAISYLMFMPAVGEGIVTTVLIVDLKKYYKNCNLLLQ